MQSAAASGDVSILRSSLDSWRAGRAGSATGGVKMTADEAQLSNLTAQVREQQVELSDYKERYRERKARCQELEALAQSRQERADYFKQQLEVQKRERINSQESGLSSQEALDQQSSLVNELKKKLSA